LLRPPNVLVYRLQFTSDADLQRAVAQVLGCDRIDDCLVDAPAGLIRFAAPELEAEALVERLYLEGGLRWCTRHAIVSGSVKLGG
jgi:hypothetical protein